MNNNVYPPQSPQFAALPQQEGSPSTLNSKQGCSCKKSLCLKLYCECFSSQSYCRSGIKNNCLCTDCHNTPQCETRRNQAVAEIRNRNPNAFTSEGKIKMVGCKCKKSKCLKKYCECFDGRNSCSDKCQCVGCMNFDRVAEISAEINRYFGGLGTNQLHREVSEAGKWVANEGDLDVWIARRLEEVRRTEMLRHGIAAPVAKGGGYSKKRKADVIEVIQAESKGPWTAEEDAKLVELVEQYGTKSWSVISTGIPGRRGKQCRERWINNLDPSITKLPWTEEEDCILLRAIIRSQKDNSSPKWVIISTQIPGRGENAVKNRWHSLQKKVEKEIYSKHNNIVDENGVYLIEESDIEACIRAASQPWTEAEDILLLQAIINAQKAGNDPEWNAISNLLPGCSDTGAKKRCDSLKKRLERFIHDKNIDGEHKIVDADGVLLIGEDDIEACVRAVEKLRNAAATMEQCSELQPAGAYAKKRNYVWSKSDEDLLLKVAAENTIQMGYQRTYDWLYIMKIFPGFTQARLQTKLTSLLNGWEQKDDKEKPSRSAPHNAWSGDEDFVTKGAWTQEEDKLLRELVHHHGPMWAIIASSIPGRRGKQCRERWINHLDPSNIKLPWSEEEDCILLRAIIQAQKAGKEGNRWVEMSSLFSGRSENAVKNRWNCLKKKVECYIHDKDEKHRLVGEDGVYLVGDDVESCIRYAREHCNNCSERTVKKAKKRQNVTKASKDKSRGRRAGEIDLDKSIAHKAVPNVHAPKPPASTIRSMRREHAMELLQPKEIGLATLIELVEQKVADGAITPERFWNATGLTGRGTNYYQEPAFPLGPTLSPYGYHRAVPPPAWHEYHKPNTPRQDPNPPPAPGQPMFKYKLITQTEVWDTNEMGGPVGILVGNQLQSSPANRRCVSGIFHSNGLVSNNTGAESQIKCIIGKLTSILHLLSASIGDILTMTIHVVDLHLHGDVIKMEKDKFLGRSHQESNFAVTIVGVSGLMHIGALVQLEISVVAREALLSNFELQKT